MKRLALVVAILLVATTTIYADGNDSQDARNWGIGLSVVAGFILTLFSGTKLAKWIKGLGFSKTTNKEVDRLVEIILTRLGVNSHLADKIGDVVATILSEIRVVHDSPDWVKDNVVTGVIRWFAGLSRKEVQSLVSVDDRLLNDRAVKVRVATEIMKDSSILNVVDAKISESLDKSRTDKQPTTSVDQG
jgi:hypothetical protein